MLGQLEIYAKPASWRNDFCNQNYNFHANGNDECFKPLELYLLTQFRILLNFAQAHDFQNFLSVRKKVGGSLREFVGVFEQFFNAQNEHFFTKKKEIHKTPAKFGGSLREFVGVFHKFLNAQNEHFFTKKKKFTKLPQTPRDY